MAKQYMEATPKEIAPVFGTSQDGIEAFFKGAPGHFGSPLTNRKLNNFQSALSDTENLWAAVKDAFTQAQDNRGKWLPKGIDKALSILSSMPVCLV